MPDFLQRVINQFLEVWRGLDTQKRIVFSAILGIVIAGIVASLVMATRPHYVLLFPSMTDSDAAQVVDKLNDWRIKYKHEGSNVLVPVERRDELRVRLAGEDIMPQGVKGWGIFDQMKIGTTDFDQKIRFRKALEEEIKRMVRIIDGINDVDVNIGVPEEKLYLDEKKPTTASLTLSLEPGFIPTKKQVKAIANLVAFSVEGLTLDNVFITDNYGNPLVLPGDEEDEEQQKQAQQLWLKTKITRQLERKVLFGLSRILTPDRVIVMVHTDMNFDMIEKMTENYRKPGFDQLKLSDEERKIDMKGLGVKPGGVPGVSSNVASYQEINQQPLEYHEEERRTNWLADKEVTKIIQSPAVRRLTASVVVDGFWKIERSGQGKILKRDYVPPSKDELETIETIVKQALGADPARQDNVVVRSLQFDRSKQFYEEDRVWERKRARQLAIAAVAGFLLLSIMLVFGYYKYKEWQRRRAEELARQREEALSRAAPALIEAELAAEERQRREMIERIRRTAIEKPDLVASVLRGWLFEES